MFDHCLYFNTTSLARQLEKEWTNAFKAFGLTPSQAFMLRVIVQKPGSTPAELAKLMNISRPTATRSLDGLQAQGLISKHAGKTDGREWVVVPSAEAVAMHEKLNAASAAVTKRLKQQLGANVFDDTVAKLKLIRSKMG